MLTRPLSLNAEASMPLLGFGTWQLTGDACSRGVAEALRIGYRHIDTADAYGNHWEVAKGIADSGIKREDFFLTTKVWRTDLAHDSLLEAGNRFLSELNTEYIDLLLIHWPNREIPIEATLRAMEELRRAGKIRAIGVSNFTEHHLEDALMTGIEITNNQVEVHPTFNQAALRAYCKSKNISITAYSPLGRGRDLDLPVIKGIAEKYAKTPAQVALNWAMARGMAAIPKSSDFKRIKENYESASFELSDEDLQKMDALPQDKRMGKPAFADFDY
jgi:diketogulonate reductase-like aldo/keto reductase